MKKNETGSVLILVVLVAIIVGMMANGDGVSSASELFWYVAILLGIFLVPLALLIGADRIFLWLGQTFFSGTINVNVVQPTPPPSAHSVPRSRPRKTRPVKVASVKDRAGAQKVERITEDTGPRRRKTKASPS